MYLTASSAAHVVVLEGADYVGEFMSFVLINVAQKDLRFKDEEDSSWEPYSGCRIARIAVTDNDYSC